MNVAVEAAKVHADRELQVERQKRCEWFREASLRICCALLPNATGEHLPQNVAIAALATAVALDAELRKAGV